MSTKFDTEKSYTNRDLVTAYWQAVWAEDTEAMGELFSEVYRRVYMRLYNSQPDLEAKAEPHALSVTNAIVDEGFVA